MPNPKRTLSIARDTSNIPVKPIPPKDLWERMEAAMNEITPARPADSFTTEEFKQRFSLSPDKSYRRLRALREGGKIKRIGHGAATYYIPL